jgi:mono/diheme cytochrome c family protein
VNRVSIGILSAAAVVLAAFGAGTVAAEDAAPAAPAAPAAQTADKPAGEAKPEGAGAPAAAQGGKMTTIERVAAAPKGTLKNPYSTEDAAVVEEGHKIFMGASCNGCHGGGGGGGMCPPLTNETWVYGGDDDTLFRLITLGSDDLKKTYNLSRKGQETVVGPMPPFGSIVTDEDKLWKIIAWVHSVWKGRPEKKTW